jgi:hypothetical protein
VRTRLSQHHDGRAQVKAWAVAIAGCCPAAGGGADAVADAVVTLVADSDGCAVATEVATEAGSGGGGGIGEEDSVVSAAAAAAGGLGGICTADGRWLASEDEVFTMAAPDLGKANAWWRRSGRTRQRSSPWPRVSS